MRSDEKVLINAVRQEVPSDMEEFTSNFYFIAEVLAFPAGVVIFILAYRTQLDAGTRGMALVGAPILAVMLSLVPILFFRELENALVFTWAFYIFIVAIIAIYAGAYRFELGYLWAVRKVITVILCIVCLPSAAWSARSVELLVCFCAGDIYAIVKVLAVIIGIIYAVLYVALNFYLLTKIINIIENRKPGKSGIAFLEKRLLSQSLKIRWKVLGKLNASKEEWACRMLMRLATTDRDAELRDRAMELVRKKDLPPDLLAELNTVLEQTGRNTAVEERVGGQSHARFCIFCGASLNANGSFCTQCGSRTPAL